MSDKQFSSDPIRQTVGRQGGVEDAPTAYTEAALRESERKYRDLWDSSPDMYFIGQPAQHRIVDCNLTLASALGYSREELVGRPSDSIFDAATFARLNEALPRYAAAGGYKNFEVQLRRRDGTLIDALMSGVFIPGATDELLQVHVTLRDITERKRMERALRLSEERFRTMFMEAPLGIALVDSLTAQVYEVNPRFAEIAGRSRAELAAIDWIQITHPDDVQADLDNMALLNAGKIKGFQMNKRYLHPDGTPIWIHMTIAPLTVEDKSQPRHLCMVEDITERRQAELALAASEARLRAVIDNTSDRIWSIDREYRLLVANDVLQHDITMQIGRALQPGEPVFDAPNMPPIKSVWQPLFDRALAGESFTVELPSTLRPGGAIEVFLNPIRDAGSEVVGAAARTVDITDRLQAEQQTREALKQIRLATDAAEIAIWKWNLTDDSLEWDKRMYELFAVPPSVRQPVHELWRTRIHPDDLARTDATLAEARRTGQDWQATFRIINPAGQTRYIYGSAVVERDREGKPVRMIGVNRDITDQKIYEQYLQDANATLEQRVAERTADLQATTAALQRANAGKDAFLAAISHEMRTPLTGIMGMAEILETQIKGPLTEHQLRYVTLIQSSGQRLLNLVNGVLFYANLMAGALTVHRELCSLADLCGVSMRPLREKAAQKDQVFVVNVEPKDLAIVSDAELVARTMTLLLDNAIKFTGEHGTFGVTADPIPDEDAVRLVIWDTGIGITPDKLPYLFDPFTQADQTLARRYEGVGIGLATVRKLVDLLGGTVHVESEPKKGSRFIVTLPVEAAPGKA